MLTLPVPETLTATYLVPCPRPVPDLAGVLRRQVEQGLAEPLRGMVQHLAGSPLLSVESVPAHRAPELPQDVLRAFGATGEQLRAVQRAEDLLLVRATYRPGWPPLHEWAARGVAVVLAEHLDADVIDPLAPRLVAPGALRRSLPDGDAPLRVADWLLVPHSAGDHGMWVTTLGLQRFGLPELQTRAVPPQLAEPWSRAMTGVARALLLQWSPRLEDDAALVELPDVLEVQEADVAAAYGREPAASGGSARVRLELEVDDVEGGAFLTVLPPLEFSASAGEHLAQVCGALFGTAEREVRRVPPDEAMAQAMARARSTLPEVRRRYLTGELPLRTHLMVKHRLPVAGGDEFPWAFVVAWDDPDVVLAHSASDAEGDPAVREGRPVVLRSESLVDWALWVDGEGVVEGGWTNAVLTGEPVTEPPSRARRSWFRRR